MVIVEAGEGSGALITADFAADQGREVFAVPGSVYSRASQGTNRLIRSGARPLVAFEEVLEALNLDVAIRQEAVSQALPEDETEAKVLQVLSAEPVHVDDIRAQCGLPAAEVSASLAMLELKGQGTAGRRDALRRAFARPAPITGWSKGDGRGVCGDHGRRGRHPPLARLKTRTAEAGPAPIR